MAHLIGIDLPVNSVGELPLIYLEADEMTKAEAAFSNARQILEQYQVKHSNVPYTCIKELDTKIFCFRREGRIRIVFQTFP